ncbi:MAG: hypothetical protein ACR2RB_16065 [Gammaproteobacteria bacterium]
MSSYYYRRISDIALLPAYAGGSLELGNVWQKRGDIELSNVITAGNLFIGADTLFGPVYLAYGQAEGGVNSFYLFVGQLF